MITIPTRESKKFIQTNRSDILGNLWATFNIDLQSNLGAIRVSPKLRVNTSTANDADFGLPCAYAHFDGRMWAVAGTRIFKNTANNIIGSFSEDASSGVRTDYTATYSDLAVFNSRLWATSSVRLQSKASDGAGEGAWTDRATITTGVAHRLSYFKKFDRLYFTDGGTSVKSISTADVEATSGDYFINIGTSLGTIQCLRSTSSDVWIGTMREITSSGADSTQGARVLRWDGISSQISTEHIIDAQGVMAMWVDNDVPYIMDSNGCLLKYTGYTFEEIGRLPLNKELLINAIGTSQWFIHPNGLVSTKNNTILALINGSLGDYSVSSLNLKENLPSGIWEWSSETGFTHKHSPTYTPVFISGVEATDITDFGQLRIDNVGGLANANLYSTNSSGRGTLMCGITYFTNATSTTHGLFIDSPIPTDITATSEGKKFGFFITDWVQASQLKDLWSKLSVRFKQFLNSSDKIILKTRFREATATNITITWASTTSFFTTTDVSALRGYEVQVENGTGAGKCAHISSVSYSAPNYSVTLDESFIGTTSGTARAVVRNWKKVGTVTGQTIESAIKTLSKTGNSSERIQVKVGMQITGDGEFYELGIINKPHTILE
jgi:hypothetical protein